jgi:2-polyprenyl-3-methyl-5-hydroxy-6-metoxy-1,4-benzoquinol methylase
MPAPSGYSYGVECQLRQKSMYMNRHKNNWRRRISLANSLLENYSTPYLKGKSKNSIVVADLGCSIGTFAIEFAKKGYKTYGLDSDPTAINIAKELAEEEKVNPTFICQNILLPNWNMPLIDVAVCFDIFEHLHDDQLGVLMQNIRLNMAENGVLIFHTFPTRYDYIFYSTRNWYKPLIPFRNFQPNTFEIITKSYAKILDIALLLKRGETHAESIANDGHCNPLTLKKLERLLSRSFYDIIKIDTDQLYPNKIKIQKIFQKHPIAYRHITGAAVPRRFG